MRRGYEGKKERKIENAKQKQKTQGETPIPFDWTLKARCEWKEKEERRRDRCVEEEVNYGGKERGKELEMVRCC